MTANRFRSITGQGDIPTDHDAQDAPPAETETLVLDTEEQPYYAHEEEVATEARSDRGGRALLGWVLAILALAWTGYAAWSAGRSLGTAPLAAPELAGWIATLAAPLAVLALVWLVFGRTRRREAERFTSAVIAMRSQALALEQQLDSLTHKINAGQQAFIDASGAMQDNAAGAVERWEGVSDRLQGAAALTAEKVDSMSASAQTASQHLEGLVERLPQARDDSDALAATLAEATGAATARSEELRTLISDLSAQADDARERVGATCTALRDDLTVMREIGEETDTKVANAREATREMVDNLLGSTSDALDQIRGGIDTQAKAVTALVEQAHAGLSHSGAQSVALLTDKIGEADDRMASLADRLGVQEAGTRQMLGDVEAGLEQLEQRFAAFADTGDARAATMRDALEQVREQLVVIGDTGAERADSLESLGSRSHDLAQQLGGLGAQLAAANESAERLSGQSADLSPMLKDMASDALVAGERVQDSRGAIEASREQLSGLLEGVDTGVGLAQQRLEELRATIDEAQGNARDFSEEMGPALVNALVQVREAATRARERALAAIREAIPQATQELSDSTAAALEKVIGEQVGSQMGELDRVAQSALASARDVSASLSRQMLAIGQTARALESHMEDVSAKQEQSGDTMARRVNQLMESMNSAAIDVEKILSEDVDEKSWAAYLKGERGIFTRKAVRLLSSRDAKALTAQYGRDEEFRMAVNSYIHDFEAMLRRVMSDPDGQAMAVTLMSSDMGKLYAALGQSVDRAR